MPTAQTTNHSPAAGQSGPQDPGYTVWHLASALTNAAWQQLPPQHQDKGPLSLSHKKLYTPGQDKYPDRAVRTTTQCCQDAPNGWSLRKEPTPKTLVLTKCHQLLRDYLLFISQNHWFIHTVLKTKKYSCALKCIITHPQLSTAFTRTGSKEFLAVFKK